MELKKVVLAYSGGLDTSIIIPWLKENYNCQVIAFAANLGQTDELEGLEEKALKTGADKCYIEDLTEEFLKCYAMPTMQAGAKYEGKYLLGTSMARPLIAKRQVEIARLEGADSVSHGATGKGNDQVRFELTYMALAPDLKIIAPWKDEKWTIRSREDAIEYAKSRNIPLTVSPEKIYSRDKNIWHISHEGGDLEDPKNAPQADLFSISKPIELAKDSVDLIEISFSQGFPIKLSYKNKETIGLVSILTELNKIGGDNAIGQVDIVENRLVGMKSRGVYETPGGSILYFAHNALESLVLDKETSHYKEILALKYADLVYNGQWFTRVRQAIDAFVQKTQEVVNGTVKLKLYKGNIILNGIDSENSLYASDIASFGQSADYDHRDANGFIKLFGLPLKIEAINNKNK